MTCQILTGLDQVPAAAWDCLAGPDDPFVEHAFLRGLEVAGCVGDAESGWVPCHVLAMDAEETIGALPLYVKFHSNGEYIFDWGWARAAAQAGLRYYPKLVSAVPFTPVTGRRLLLDSSAATREAAIVAALNRGLREVADRVDASSAHVLFATGQEIEGLETHDFLPRASYQFHWENQGDWGCFEDYLAALKSRMRKQIRKERSEAQSHGLTLSVRPGTELGRADWQALWHFYRITADRKMAIPYLTRELFDYLPTHLAHRVVATMAHRGEKPVAGALMFHKGRRLCGRYWGSLEHLPFLHFELCYYLPIAWCLENGVSRFEAGAQGEHKLKRGLLPRRCHSAHWVRHPALAQAIADFLPREAAAVDLDIQLLAKHAPFRREGA